MELLFQQPICFFLCYFKDVVLAKLVVGGRKILAPTAQMLFLQCIHKFA